jgi:hypothetical protein
MRVTMVTLMFHISSEFEFRIMTHLPLMRLNFKYSMYRCVTPPFEVKDVDTSVDFGYSENLEKSD